MLCTLKALVFLYVIFGKTAYGLADSAPFVGCIINHASIFIA